MRAVLTAEKVQNLIKNAIIVKDTFNKQFQDIN